ncbi:MAG: hypothetical protein LBI29_01690 [Rickettsiales bacterium]|nr:hypothetical protein [Rickettsiales bacterium]
MEEDRNAKLCSEHIANKSKTCFIESINSRIRNYLARLNRRTKKFGKSLEMLCCYCNSLPLLFNEFYWGFKLVC